MKNRRLKMVLTASVSIMMLGSAAANNIAVDGVIYQTGVNPALLSGTVDMTPVIGGIILTLQNTSDTAAGTGAGVLLTGVGFELPAGVTLDGGFVWAPSFGEVKPQGTYYQDDLWGYRFKPTEITAGHFGSYLNPIGRAVNSVVTTMVADGDLTFSGFESDGQNLGGPEWGLLASGGNAGGQSNPGATIDIFLRLGGNIPSDLLSYIDRHDVFLTFGSPTAGVYPPPPTPDGGTTFLLMGAAITGLVMVRRRFMQ